MDTPRSTSRFRELVGRRRWIFSIAAAAVTADLACFIGDDEPSSDAGADAAACEKVLPADCGTVPSYVDAIAPIVAAHCLECHAPNGVASDRDLTTYANIQKLESTVLSQVYSCAMPPADAGADAMLSGDDRTTLLRWLVCGSPND